MTKVNHLQSLCVIHVDFDIWSGQTRLSASDLKLGEGGEIPPEKVAQLGSKKICDPAKLKGFHRLKTETRRLMLKFGMPFMNGFAVPVNKADEICDRLNEVSSEFNRLKQDFINSYNNAVDEWVKENPEYERAIRTGALPRETVEERIGFDYQMFMIQPVHDDDISARRLNRKVERLGDDLISEVVQEANKFYLERLHNRDQCAVTTRQTLRNIRDKVDGLSFLNSAFTPLVDLLDQTLRGYEQYAEGRNIVAPFFYQVTAAVLIMCERPRVEEYARGCITVEGMAQAITGNTPLMGGNSGDQAERESETKADRSEGSQATDETVQAQIADTVDESQCIADDDIDTFFKNFAESCESNQTNSQDNAENDERGDEAVKEELQEEILPASASVLAEGAQNSESPKVDPDDDCYF